MPIDFPPAQVQSTARQHHFVSQCYLKGFVKDRDRPRLYVVDAKEHRAFRPSPAAVARERDFHRIELEGHAPDAIEKAFAKFEGELDQSLRRIVERRAFHDVDDRANVFNFIGMLAIKNPRYRETMRKMRETTAKMVLDLATSTPERWATQVRKATKDGFIPPDLSVTYEEARQFARDGAFTVEVPTTMHIQTELKIFDSILPFIFNRGWVLLRSPVDSTGFVTSDHPMCLSWSKPSDHGGHPAGLGLRETRVLFPLSNELALLGEFEKPNATFDADELLIAQINSTIITFSQRQVYARDDDFAYVSPLTVAPHWIVKRGGELLADLAVMKGQR